MTNPEIAQRQAEIDARVAAATEGPWTVHLWGLLDNQGKKMLQSYSDDAMFDRIEDAEFCANAMPDLEWQRERIKALEAENTHLTEWVNAALEANFALAKRNINQCKWARCWKQEAKRERSRVYELRRLADSGFKMRLALTKRCMVKDNRIAALENAAKSCSTCVHLLTSDLVDLTRYCREHCGKPNTRYAGWVFNEERFASEPKRDDNDV